MCVEISALSCNVKFDDSLNDVGLNRKTFTTKSESFTAEEKDIEYQQCGKYKA